MSLYNQKVSLFKATKVFLMCALQTMQITFLKTLLSFFEFVQLKNSMSKD